MAKRVFRSRLLVFAASLSWPLLLGGGCASDKGPMLPTPPATVPAQVAQAAGSCGPVISQPLPQAESGHAIGVKSIDIEIDIAKPLDKATTEQNISTLEKTGHGDAAGILRFIANRQQDEAPVPPAQRPAMACWITKVGVNGNCAPIRDGDKVSKQDKYVLCAMPGTVGHLYIFQIDSWGKVDWVFPRNDACNLSSGANPVAAGGFIQTPENRKKAYVLDNHVGMEHVYFVFSSKPCRELEKVLTNCAKEFDPAGHASAIEVGCVFGSKDIEIYRPTVFPDDARTACGDKPGEPRPKVAEAVAGGSFMVIERWFNHVDAR